MELVKCCICGFEGIQLTSHIIRKHKVTIDYYKSEFPNSDLSSKQFRLEKSKNTISPFDIKFWLNKTSDINEADTLYQEFLNKHKNKMKSASHFTKEYWINKGYSEKESINIISKNSCHDLEFFINKYGKEDGTNRYNEVCKKIGYSGSLQKLLDNNASENEIIEFKKRKDTLSLQSFIKRYGKEDGTKRYELYNSRRGLTRDLFVIKYGEHHGNLRFNSWKNSCSHDLEFFINKYGKEDGTNRYNDWVIKATACLTSYSKTSIELFELLDETILRDSYYGETEFRVDKYFVDFKYKNKIIEFYGDFWHCNPLQYNKDYFHPILNLYSEEVWDKDSKRLDYIKSKGYEVYIVWESDFIKNKDKVLYNIIKYLKEEKN